MTLFFACKYSKDSVGSPIYFGFVDFIDEDDDGHFGRQEYTF